MLWLFLIQLLLQWLLPTLWLYWLLLAVDLFLFLLLFVIVEFTSDVRASTLDLLHARVHGCGLRSSSSTNKVFTCVIPIFWVLRFLCCVRLDMMLLVCSRSATSQNYIIDLLDLISSIARDESLPIVLVFIFGTWSPAWGSHHLLTHPLNISETRSHVVFSRIELPLSLLHATIMRSFLIWLLLAWHPVLEQLQVTPGNLKLLSRVVTAWTSSCCVVGTTISCRPELLLLVLLRGRSKRVCRVRVVLGSGTTTETPGDRSRTMLISCTSNSPTLVLLLLLMMIVVIVLYRLRAAFIPSIGIWLISRQLLLWLIGRLISLRVVIVLLCPCPNLVILLLLVVLLLLLLLLLLLWIASTILIVPEPHRSGCRHAVIIVVLLSHLLVSRVWAFLREPAAAGGHGITRLSRLQHELLSHVFQEWSLLPFLSESLGGLYLVPLFECPLGGTVTPFHCHVVTHFKYFKF